MIKKEQLMDIRSLAKQGYSIRAIARKTGLHRETVKKYLVEKQLPVYKKINRSSKLDDYKSLIKGWLEQDDYQATRIFELLIVEGYEGSYGTVRRYVKELKEQRARIAYIRFETKVGEQAQVDFGDFQIIEADGSKTTVYCFVMVLGYSRHKYVEFIDRCTMPKFLACHQHAFGFFGGIPAEIIYDNMKNVVTKRLVGGGVQWNKTFEFFAMHYGYKPEATPPYSPWVKGKVERPIKYIRERFWRGYTFNNLDESNKNIREWLLNVAGTRTHGTTKEQVLTRFKREQPFLGSLPHSNYDISEKLFRKVSKDCQISFDGNRYVLPHEVVGKTIVLRVKDGIIRFFDDDAMIAVYRIPEGLKGQTLAHPEFYKKLKEDKEQLRRKYQKPPGKAKATRGLLKGSWQTKVMQRSLKLYDQLI